MKRVSGKSTSAYIFNLTEGQICFFRLKSVGEGEESPYSAVVGVNNDFMNEGGGTKANTTTFTPKAGMLYRIINYATIPFNSGTTINGAPKYLVCNADGSLGTTENFTWDDQNLLWTITEAEGGFHIRNYGTQLYFTPNNVSTGAGDDRIGTTDTPSVFTINYTGNQTPSQSGLSVALSMYRINSPSNGDQQIRARHFENDWIWGSGTFDRSDMVFTFVEIEEAKINPEAVGVREIHNAQFIMHNEAGAVYDLSGRIINSQCIIHNSQLPKGVYIQNGKLRIKK